MYESEDQLHAHLADSPEFLLGETAESGSRPGYLLRRRGSPRAGREGPDRWFLDHIFLDREGMPTLVEVKRSTNTQVRREVVGQMLDYAANILAHWPPDRMAPSLRRGAKRQFRPSSRSGAFVRSRNSSTRTTGDA
jgi:hypothetical protein